MGLQRFNPPKRRLVNVLLTFGDGEGCEGGGRLSKGIYILQESCYFLLFVLIIHSKLSLLHSNIAHIYSPLVQYILRHETIVKSLHN